MEGYFLNKMGKGWAIYDVQCTILAGAEQESKIQICEKV